MAAVEGNERVIATAQQIVKSLGTSKNAEKDMLMILSSFDNRFSDLRVNSPSSEMEDSLDLAEEKLLKWDLDSTELSTKNSLLWENFPEEAKEYLTLVDKVIDIAKTLENTSLKPDDKDAELLDRSQTLIQIAMARLEDEFRHILIRNTMPLNPSCLFSSFSRVSRAISSVSRVSITSTDESRVARVSLGSNDDSRVSRVSIGSNEDSIYDDDEEEVLEEDFTGEEYGGEAAEGLIRIEAIEDLKEIAECMLSAGYERECCQVYASVRREVFDECLSNLGVEKLSIEEIQKIEWNELDGKVKKWIQAIKILVKVLLSGEKNLLEKVFEYTEEVRHACFIESAKGSVMQLLNFGEAIAIGRRKPEKLFRILDMYDGLAEVLEGLNSLFCGDHIVAEAEGLLTRLGDAAKVTLEEFDNAIKRDTSRVPVQGGALHPLTRYVMNYVKLLVDYSDTLNTLLEGTSDNNWVFQGIDEDSGNVSVNSPLAQRLLCSILSLESNLEEKSKLYKDMSMQCIFLMNNIHYIVRKVKDSELGELLGDDWVRRHRGKVKQLATNYLRASWNRVLACLKDEGLSGVGGSSSSVSKVALKERFKSFNSGFEEIYRNQTAWMVPDAQLRDDLRISISTRVIPAYRAFMGRFSTYLENGRHAERYIKFTPEDLENYIEDLFEGSPGSLNNPRRKISS
ncbi:exocyst complex component EXO70B1 [Amborella trichopoda]|uniref:Exocyst subunit Exo70 family protein n=1 Tax=Amborella trichopoda TaxID=13333 RepID=W1PQ65_AMBTC|nr:exocyst complex component EXO70B1 [Amborella trichopoda]XP_011624899.1 exocyst complex component EXO70B1 [Amborella trichopoda]ERN09954.1 hypothetical protein AMTR_s00013p00198120 [Amborella trichopoda]|eukprot:XP_006848373.1 exocyst complex component EXO70B1 [Amborella trichopoda]